MTIKKGGDDVKIVSVMVVFFFLFFQIVAVPIAHAEAVGASVARLALMVASPSSLATLGGVVLAVTVAGVVGYYVLPPGTTLAIADWFRQKFGFTGGTPTGPGVFRTKGSSGAGWSMDLQRDANENYFVASITPTPTMDIGSYSAPRFSDIASANDYVLGLTSTLDQYNTGGGGVPVFVDAVPLPDTIQNITPEQAATMPAITGAYATPGLPNYAVAGANPSVVLQQSGIAAGDIPSVAGQLGAVPVGQGQSQTVSLDKSGLATDTNQAAQLVQGTSIISKLTQIGESILSFPDNVVSAIGNSLVPTVTVADRVQSLRIAASEKFPFSAGTYQAAYSTGTAFSIPTWQLEPGKLGTTVHTDIFGSIFGGVVSFARSLIVLVIWSGFVFLVYRRMVSL
jgi:hypothetical protein